MKYLQIRDEINKRLGKDTKLRPLLEFAQGVDFGVRYVRYEKMPRPSRAATREVFAEWVNYCNLRCSFCALDHNQAKERMTLETWDRLLKELTREEFRNVQALHLHNGGETLLHPKVDELLARMDDHFLMAKGMGWHVPEVDLLSNGLVLTEAKTEALLHTHTLTTIRFSMDGGTPEQFEAMRVRAKWDRFYPQVKALLEANRALARPKKIGIIAVLPDAAAMKAKNFHPEYQEILDLVDEVEFRVPHNWAGQLDGEDRVARKPWKLGCNMMMDELVVYPGGGVSICCNDLNAVAVVGNIHDEGGLYGAYQAEQRKKWLGSIARNRTQDIPLCTGCERF